MVQNNARFCSMCSLLKCRLCKQSKSDSDIVLLENTLQAEPQAAKHRPAKDINSENELPNSFFNLHGSRENISEMPTPRYCFTTLPKFILIAP